MQAPSFEARIKSLCDATGITDWQQVVQGGHMAVNQRTLGLIGEPESGDLLVFLDCGDAFEARDPQVFRRILYANVAFPALFGSFGLHPETGGVVYRMRLAAQAQLDGHELAALVATQVELAMTTLELVQQG